jgi:preprotein translocase subunit Sss1
VKTLDDQSPGPLKRLTHPPYSIRQITSHPNWPAAAQPLLEMYDAILTKAKYARSEPDAEEYERCIKIVALIMGL